MSSGYSYGSIRRNGLGGLFSKSSGVGPGQRHGMSGQGVGTVKKARDLVLGDGTQIVVDIVCRRCGHEQPHNYYRSRCQNCQAPLKIVHRDMFNVNQLKLQYSKKIQAASGPNPETQLAISSPKTMITMSPMTQSFKNQKTVVTSTARVRDVGGLKTREAGLGPGSRHGMSGRDIGTMTKAREMVLGDGTKITVDIVCRRCGHEQPSNYFRLRCQRCDGVLKQLGVNDKTDMLRSVGGIYKRPSGQKSSMTVTYHEHIRYDKKHAIENGVTYNSFSRTKTMPRTDADIQQLISIDSPKVRKGMGAKYLYPKHVKNSPPSLSNLRKEAVEVRGNWIKAVAMKTGKPYYYNAKSKEATWDSEKFDSEKS